METDSANDRAGLNQRQRVWVTGLIVAVCGATLYSSIASFQHHVPTYNVAVAERAVFFSTFLLPVLIFGPALPLPARRQWILAMLAALALFLSAATSPDVENSMVRLRAYYLFVVTGVFLFAALRSSTAVVVPLVLLAMAVIHVGFLIVALLASSVTLNLEPVATPPYFSNVRHFGYHGFLAACAASGLLVLDRKLRMPGMLLASASLFGLILFGSRGALVAWFIYLLVLCAVLQSARRFIPMSILAFILAFAAAGLSTSQQWFNADSLFERATQTYESGQKSLLDTAGRQSVWRDAASAVAERPFLGFGPEGFLISRCCNQQFVQPHNSALQLLLEFGAVGLLLIAGTVIAVAGPRIWDSLLRSRGRALDPCRASVLAMLTAFVSFSLIDGLFYHAVPLLHFAIIVALFFGAPEMPVERANA